MPKTPARSVYRLLGIDVRPLRKWHPLSFAFNGLEQQKQTCFSSKKAGIPAENTSNSFRFPFLMP
jgi:hypothetical protein